VAEGEEFETSIQSATLALDLSRLDHRARQQASTSGQIGFTEEAFEVRQSFLTLALRQEIFDFGNFG